VEKGRIDWKRDVIPLLPFLQLGFSSGLFTAWVERKFIGAEEAHSLYFHRTCLIAAEYFGFILENNLAFQFNIYLSSRNVSQDSWQYLFPIATLILAGTVWKLRRQWRAPLAALFCYVAAIFQ